MERIGKQRGARVGRVRGDKGAARAWRAILVATLGAAAGTAFAAANDSIEATGLSYDVDAALTYIDAFQHLPAQIATGPVVAPALADSNPQSTVTQPRTLGLRRMKVGLTWQAPYSSSLRLVLRPDAVNREFEAGGLTNPPREFDDRSGDPGMQPMPTIRLLDAYQLSLFAARELSFGFGVWEGFGETTRAYSEQLGFGLTVLFPARFSGVRLAWQLPDTAPDSAAAPGPQLPRLTMSAYLIEGNEDRAELLAEKHSSFDTAPTAQDPYHGGGLVLRWRLRPQLSLGLLVGYLQEADPVGSYDEVFTQLNGDWLFTLLGQNVRACLDSRYAHFHGHGSIADQTLMSATATAAVPVMQSLWAIIGISDGAGSRWQSYLTERQSTVNLSGYQLEGGLLQHVARNTSLQLILSHEYRTLRSGSVESGGFQDAAGSQSTIHRIGLELTYQLNQNA